MQIHVNGDATDVADGATVAALLRQFELAPNQVAVEINEQLVRRTTYDDTALQPGDLVEIVTLVGGG